MSSARLAVGVVAADGACRSSHRDAPAQLDQRWLAPRGPPHPARKACVLTNVSVPGNVSARGRFRPGPASGCPGPGARLTGTCWPGTDGRKLDRLPPEVRSVHRRYGRRGSSPARPYVGFRNRSRGRSVDASVRTTSPTNSGKLAWSNAGRAPTSRRASLRAAIGPDRFGPGYKRRRVRGYRRVRAKSMESGGPAGTRLRFRRVVRDGGHQP